MNHLINDGMTTSMMEHDNLYDISDAGGRRNEMME